MLIVASQNPHKVEELRALIRDVPVRVVGGEVLPPGPEVEETGKTFSQNAAIKALEYARRASALGRPGTPVYVMADDSGLCVDALGGAPGVFSARYAGERCSYADNNRKLLRALEGVPAGRRDARFVCAIACARAAEEPAGSPRILFRVEGSCRGAIAREERGTEGFGYDPVFIEETTGRTFAEMSPEKKNLLSHRGDALRKFRKSLLEALDATGRDP